MLAGWIKPHKRFPSPALKLVALIIALTITAFGLTGCGGDSGASDGITVFAAASLTESFTEIGAAFEAEHDGSQVTFNFAGSQALATQLIEGASADVFASANVDQMDRTVSEHAAAEPVTTFVLNQLTVIVPVDNPAGISSVADLANPDLKLVLAAETVPVGNYSRQMFAKLAADQSDPEAFASAIQSNIVSNESNVKQVVAKVQLGEADAGVAYGTDVTPAVAPDVMQIEIPESDNIQARYVIAPVSKGNHDKADEFITFITSDEAVEILHKFGFITVEH